MLACSTTVAHLRSRSLGQRLPRPLAPGNGHLVAGLRAAFVPRLRCIEACTKTVHDTSSNSSGLLLFFTRSLGKTKQQRYPRAPPPDPAKRAEASPEKVIKVKTDIRGWVCAVSAVILSCSAALLG